MAEPQIGLSPEFIIHPGETLLEVLEEKNMSQRELAIRTGVSASFVNNIIQGSKSISTSYSKKLEYVLGINSQFWINLQANYDKEMYEYQELCQVSDEEKNIAKYDLKQIATYFMKVGIIKPYNDIVSKVLELRKALQVSDLTLIPNLKICGAYRYASNAEVNPYVMFAWRRLCELRSDDKFVSGPLDVECLKKSIKDIRKIMLINDVNLMKAALTSIFAKCGIIFSVVRNFNKAPVQGFIKETENGCIILCMTIRNAYADIFWFTLFHEIAHIINGDYKEVMIDYEKHANSKQELAADHYARNILIPDDEYQAFVDKGNFSSVSIVRFSRQKDIKPFVLVGRLQKNKYIPYTWFSEYKERYKWCND